MRRDLPDNVNPAFHACAPSLMSAFEEECSLVLGGGTVLASRWNHRVSTDLDFFLHGDEVLIPRYIRAAGEKLASIPQVFENLVVHPRHLSFVCMGTQTSVFSTASLMHMSTSEEESSTALPLDTTEEILAKKLSGRIMGLGDILIRDLYDICVASRLDPASYAKALTVLTNEELQDIAAELTSFISNPSKDRDLLIDPTFKNLGENVWLYAQILFRGRSLPDHLFHQNTHERPTGRGTTK